jgi:predicted small lipoprotein YifL
MIRALAIAALALVLAACGQKGPLKLPGAPAAPGVPAPVPATPPSSP